MNGSYEKEGTKKIKEKRPGCISESDIGVFKKLNDALKDRRLDGIIGDKDVKIINRTAKIGEGGFGNIFDIIVINNKVKNNIDANITLVAKKTISN